MSAPAARSTRRICWSSSNSALPVADDHSVHSSLREGLLAHLFVGEVMRTLWLRGVRDFEVLRPVTDAAGNDVVLAANGVIRHVQLNASAQGARTARQKINVALGRQPSGCVVRMRFAPESMQLGPFGWFGNTPGVALPDLGNKVGRHTKGTAEGIKTQRSAIRVLNKRQFDPVPDVDGIADRLFGTAADLNSNRT